MGVTVSVASGDEGSSNLSNDNQCLCNVDSSSDILDRYKWNGPSWSGQGYFPSFPATCPYVTTVGATMGPSIGKSEIPCQSQLGGRITTGGGFSSFYSQSPWQKEAVDNYFSNVQTTSHAPLKGYNPVGRAYPDISMIGSDFEIEVEGEVQYVSGTSCSAPVFAAFISLLNSARLAKQLPAVGFINPTLYSAGYNKSENFFNDITIGSNKCCSGYSSDITCCSTGFTATRGWDPVSGWGSIDYIQLAKIFSVTTSYVPIGDTDDYTDDDLKSILFYRKIILIIIGILSSLLICHWTYTCFKRYWNFSRLVRVRRHNYTPSIATSSAGDAHITMEFPSTSNVIHEIQLSTQQNQLISNTQISNVEMVQ